MYHLNSSLAHHECSRCVIGTWGCCSAWLHCKMSFSHNKRKVTSFESVLFHVVSTIECKPMLTMLTYWIKEFGRTWDHPNCAATWRFNRPWEKTIAMLRTASVVRLEMFRIGFSQIASEYQTCWEHVMICLAGFARWPCCATVSIEGSAARLQNTMPHCGVILGTLPTIFEIDQKAPACIRFLELLSIDSDFDFLHGLSFCRFNVRRKLLCLRENDSEIATA